MRYLLKTRYRKTSVAGPRVHQAKSRRLNRAAGRSFNSSVRQLNFTNIHKNKNKSQDINGRLTSIDKEYTDALTVNGLQSEKKKQKIDIQGYI